MLSYEQNNEIEARKSLIRRDLAYGFDENEICAHRGISKKILRDTIKLICEEDNEYLRTIKEKELATDIRIMKTRFLDVYKDTKIMFSDIKNDNNVSVRDKTELLRFMCEISAAILKIETEGVTLIKSRLPSNFNEMADGVKQYKEIHQLEDKLPEDETEESKPDTIVIKPKSDDDPQRIF